MQSLINFSLSLAEDEHRVLGGFERAIRRLLIRNGLLFFPLRNSREALNARQSPYWSNRRPPLPR